MDLVITRVGDHVAKMINTKHFLVLFFLISFTGILGSLLPKKLSPTKKRDDGGSMREAAVMTHNFRRYSDSELLSPPPVQPVTRAPGIRRLIVENCLSNAVVLHIRPTSPAFARLVDNKDNPRLPSFPIQSPVPASDSELAPVQFHIGNVRDDSDDGIDRDDGADLDMLPPPPQHYPLAQAQAPNPVIMNDQGCCDDECRGTCKDTFCSCVAVCGALLKFFC